MASINSLCCVTLATLIIFSHYSAATNATLNSSISSCPIQSLFQFGDSFSDTGNLDRLVPLISPASHMPYGETFPGKPTGRWSDGRLIIDYAAMELGLPFLNPYLDKNASFENGVNFAVAGSTAQKISFFLMRGILALTNVAPLDVQLSSFKAYLRTICSTPAECADKLRRALFFVGESGFNDINISIIVGRKTLQEIQTYVPFIIEAIISTTREIIQVSGAQLIVVPGNFPMGCFPIFLKAFAGNSSEAYDELGCIKRLNNLVINQNTNLQAALNSLKTEFPNATIIYADFYNAFLTILRAGPDLGFDPTTLFQPCCKSGDYDPLSPRFCGNLGVPVCPDPNQYIHWDGIHLTQNAYSHISQIVLRDVISKIKCVD